jgi:hypothetical protein
LSPKFAVNAVRAPIDQSDDASKPPTKYTPGGPDDPLMREFEPQYFCQE